MWFPASSAPLGGVVKDIQEATGSEQSEEAPGVPPVNVPAGMEHQEGREQAEGKTKNEVA